MYTYVCMCTYSLNQYEKNRPKRNRMRIRDSQNCDPMSESEHSSHNKRMAEMLTPIIRKNFSNSLEYTLLPKMQEQSAARHVEENLAMSHQAPAMSLLTTACALKSGHRATECTPPGECCGQAPA